MKILKKNRLLLLSAVAFALSLSWGPSLAHAEHSESDIKAAFLLAFGSYVTFPGDAEARGVICVARQGPTEKALLRMAAAKRKRGGTAFVRGVAEGCQLDGCSFMYLESLSASARQALLAKLGTRPVLTISDAEGFTRAGGNVRFFRKGRNIRIEINVASVNSADIKVSPKMLRLAKLI